MLNTRDLGLNNTRIKSLSAYWYFLKEISNYKSCCVAQAVQSAGEPGRRLEENAGMWPSSFRKGCLHIHTQIGPGDSLQWDRPPTPASWYICQELILLEQCLFSSHTQNGLVSYCCRKDLVDMVEPYWQSSLRKTVFSSSVAAEHLGFLCCQHKSFPQNLLKLSIRGQ